MLSHGKPPIAAFHLHAARWGGGPSLTTKVADHVGVWVSIVVRWDTQASIVVAAWLCDGDVGSGFALCLSSLLGRKLTLRVASPVWEKLILLSDRSLKLLRVVRLHTHVQCPSRLLLRGCQNCRCLWPHRAWLHLLRQSLLLPNHGYLQAGPKAKAKPRSRRSGQNVRDARAKARAQVCTQFFLERTACSESVQPEHGAPHR